MSEAEQPIEKVLLIDDEAEVVHYFEQAFKNFPHIEFISSTQALKGMEMAREHKPKVLMIDLRMPEINGEDAIRELKPELPDTKFIVMSGWDDDKLKEQLLTELGVDDFFDKPVDIESVIGRVMQYLMAK